MEISSVNKIVINEWLNLNKFMFLTDDVIGADIHTIKSDGFFDLTCLPERVVIIGRGYIAVELAGSWFAPVPTKWLWVCT